MTEVFLTACKTCNLELVKLLLASELVDIHAQDDCSLRWASENGHIEVVKVLIEAGADIHAQDDCSLRLASENGHTEIVKVLIESGADIHAKNDCSLRYASWDGHLEVVKVLIESGADIHALDDYALRIASSHGHIEVVKVLLDKGAYIHADTDYALRLASKKGHIEVVKVLIEAGADIHAKNDYALRLASENGHTEIVKLLTDKAASIGKAKELQEDAPKGLPRVEDVVKEFAKVYNFLYEQEDDKAVNGYADSLSDGDRFIKEHPEYMKAFIKHRGDILSSDREVVAFSMAMKNLKYKDLSQGEKLVQQAIDSVVIPEDQREARIQAATAVQVLSGIPLAGLTFCVTGKVNYGTRDDLHMLIESKGGKTAPRVTKGVDYLITNTPFSGTSKNKAAQANGCHIISEQEFMKMLQSGERPQDYNNAPKPATPYVAQVYGTVKGKTFCITGRVNYPGKRAALQSYIRTLGGYNADKIDYGVDYLITNDPFSGSSKNREAKRIGCKVITEEQFLEMARQTQ